MNESGRIYIEGANFRRFLNFYIWDADGGFVQYGIPIIQAIDAGCAVNKPSLSLRWDQGQDVLDALYKLGFRPSDYLIRDQSNRDSHLADMKRLVEKAYKVKF